MRNNGSFFLGIFLVGIKVPAGVIGSWWIYEYDDGSMSCAAG
jgi:hypothetical protein